MITGSGVLPVIALSNLHPTERWLIVVVAVCQLALGCVLFFGAGYRLYRDADGHPIRQFIRDMRDLPKHLGWRR